MRETLFAERYLNAFLNCLEQTKKEAALNELKAVLSVVFNNQNLKTILARPYVSYDIKASLLKKVLPSADELVVNFLLLLIKKQRFSLFKTIFNSLDETILTIRNVVVLNVFSSNQLQSEQMNQIEVFGKAYFNKNVELVQHIDETLLAGFRIKTRGVTVDVTLRNSLNELVLSFNK
jgi:F-type H+-transporting ATPase subunit delta